MNKKNLLVLAASRYQIPTIVTAKRLGYRVITTDNLPENPGHALADQSYSVDTTDLQGVLEIAQKEQIDGIIAACTDVAVPTAAYVAAQLGLTGVPFESARIACDKLAFREFLHTHAFPVPRSLPVSKDTSPEENLFQQRWIIKPDRSSGSKGVFILHALDDFYRYLPETLHFSPTQTGIMEEFFEGHQGTCEGVLQNGELALAFVMDRQTVASPYVATCGQSVPSRLSDRLQARLLDILSDIWRRLEVKDGPFDCDFVATEDEIYILEVTPRIGGNSISALIRQAAGFDLVAYSVCQACGDGYDVSRPEQVQPTAIVLLGVPEAGRLAYNPTEMAALMQEEWVISLSFDVPWGAEVQPFINGRHRVGEALVVGQDRDDLDQKAQELKTRLCLRAL